MLVRIKLKTRGMKRAEAEKIRVAEKMMINRRWTPIQNQNERNESRNNV